MDPELKRLNEQMQTKRQEADALVAKAAATAADLDRADALYGEAEGFAQQATARVAVLDRQKSLRERGVALKSVQDEPAAPIPFGRGGQGQPAGGDGASA